MVNVTHMFLSNSGNSDSYYTGDYVKIKTKATELEYFNKGSTAAANEIIVTTCGNGSNEYVESRLAELRKPTRDLNKFMKDNRLDRIKQTNIVLRYSIVTSRGSSNRSVPLLNISREYWNWSITLREEGIYLAAQIEKRLRQTAYDKWFNR